MFSANFSQLALLCVLIPVLCTAQNAAPAWDVQSPYSNNPLKQALLTGDASHAGLSTKAELQIECRPDVDGPRIDLMLTPAEVKFNADPFEGPGGLGERQKLRVTLGKTEWSHHFSGSYVEANSFAFSFALLPAEARQITSPASEHQLFSITIDPAKAGSPLQFHFTLPPSNDAAGKMVAPCLGKPHKS